MRYAIFQRAGQPKVELQILANATGTTSFSDFTKLICVSSVCKVLISKTSELNGVKCLFQFRSLASKSAKVKAAANAGE
jgi:hypothetical protein